MAEKIVDSLCDLLELASVWETDQGGLAANGAAEQRLGAELPATMADAVKALAGGQVALPGLGRCLHSARSGGSEVLSVGPGITLLLGPVGEGRARAVLTRQETQRSARLVASDLQAGVSHELANALGAIVGWARLARQGQRVDEALELIESSASHAWAAAKNVLGSASGRRSEAPTEVDLSELVDEAARLIMPKATTRGVRVRTSIAPDLRVHAHRNELWTIVWNLAANAVEAMQHGGNLGLDLSSHGDVVRLRVEDDGPGMDEGMRERVFEPYFTTKDSGTGLGLSLVRESTEQMGGSIQLESAPGRGSCFLVELPRVAGARTTRRRRLSSGKRSSGVFLSDHLRGPVLVVDDDRPLREMVATAIGMRGATVTCVESGAEALAAGGPFELAVIDLVLPDGAGDRLLADLRARGQVKHAILATGMELPETFAKGGEPSAVLRKPYELEELFESLVEVLKLDDTNTAAG